MKLGTSYPNLDAEMARSRISRHDLAKATGVTYKSISQRLNGTIDFSVTEAKKIQALFGGEFTIEYLFKNE
jgi:DNA-binding XRE family transcriptional regulator